MKKNNTKVHNNSGKVDDNNVELKKKESEIIEETNVKA